MRYVRIFKSIESELGAMEKEINGWVDATKANIVSVTGNIAPQGKGAASHGFSASDVLVVVIYEPAE